MHKKLNMNILLRGLEWLTSFKKIYGILNGIDTKLYDPKNTKNIYPFDENNLENKEKIRNYYKKNLV